LNTASAVGSGWGVDDQGIEMDGSVGNEEHAVRSETAIRTNKMFVRFIIV
jgi:hypothetical protein